MSPTQAITPLSLKDLSRCNKDEMEFYRRASLHQYQAGYLSHVDEAQLNEEKPHQQSKKGINNEAQKSDLE